MALAGGRTPRGVYERLANCGAGAAVPWARTRIFWGDERFVPRGHPGSNFRMARETLLARVPVPESNLFPMPTEAADADAAAREYERTLRGLFPGAEFPRFDLVLLGIGADGHTASLFPGGPECEEAKRWCVASRAPAGASTGDAIRERVTLTLPVLNAARVVAFLVAGEDKRTAVGAVLGTARRAVPGTGSGTGRPAQATLPAQRVRPSGPLLLFTDLRLD